MFSDLKLKQCTGVRLKRGLGLGFLCFSSVFYWSSSYWFYWHSSTLLLLFIREKSFLNHGCRRAYSAVIRYVASSASIFLIKSKASSEIRFQAPDVKSMSYYATLSNLLLGFDPLNTGLPVSISAKIIPALNISVGKL